MQVDNENLEKCIREKLLENQNHAGYWYCLGMIQLNSKRFDDAIYSFQTVISLDNHSHRALSNLSYCYLQKRESPLALEAAKKSLQIQPDYREGWVNLGCAQLNMDMNCESIVSFEEALKKQENDTELLYFIGLAKMKESHFSEAVEYFQKVVQANKTHLDAHINLAASFIRLKMPKKAIKYAKKATELKPTSSDAWHNLGSAQLNLDKDDQAIVSIHKGLKISPTDHRLLSLMGKAMIKKCQYEKAVPFLKKAIQQNKEDIQSYIHLAIALLHLGKYQEASSINEKVLAQDPLNLVAQSNKAYLALCFGKIDRAIEIYEKVLEEDPKNPDVLNNLAASYSSALDIEKSIDVYKKNIKLNPNNFDTFFMLGMSYLVLGDYRSGFEWYEGRLKHKTYHRLAKITTPQWNGQNLKGKTLLVLCEQGFGDSIQFMRYLPLLQAMGCKIILQLQTALHCVAKDLRYQIIDRIPSTPKHDFHVSLMSLPHRFKTELDTIPPPLNFGYTPKPIKNRIGIAWRGNPEHKKDLQRSIDLTLLEKSLSIPGKNFICLQKDLTKKEKKILDLHKVHRPELTLFSHTADLISSCELIISVDTAVAHLAGSIGVPTWILVAYSPDWRWLLDRVDSPWYPSVRLFRQKTINNWEEPIVEMVNALTH